MRVSTTVCCHSVAVTQVVTSMAYASPRCAEVHADRIVARLDGEGPPRQTKNDTGGESPQLVGGMRFSWSHAARLEERKLSIP